MGIDGDATVPRDRRFGEEGRRLRRRFDEPACCGRGSYDYGAPYLAPYLLSRTHMHNFPPLWERKAWL